MQRLLVILAFVAALLPGLALPQTPDGTPSDPVEEAVAEVDAAAGEDDADANADDDEDRVLETDDESYLDIEEEDFRPSEEIPTDQSIAFPVDI